jgi:hypothetical protein
MGTACKGGAAGQAARMACVGCVDPRRWCWSPGGRSWLPCPGAVLLAMAVGMLAMAVGYWLWGPHMPLGVAFATLMAASLAPLPYLPTHVGTLSPSVPTLQCVVSLL